MKIKEKIEILNFIYDRLSKHYNEPEGIDFMLKLREIIDDTVIDAGNDQFVLVVENDNGNGDWMRSNGPMAMETMLSNSDALSVIERGKRVKGSGRRMVCRLEPLCDCGEFPELINESVVVELLK